MPYSREVRLYSYLSQILEYAGTSEVSTRGEEPPMSTCKRKELHIYLHHSSRCEKACRSESQKIALSIPPGRRAKLYSYIHYTDCRKRACENDTSGFPIPLSTFERRRLPSHFHYRYWCKLPCGFNTSATAISLSICGRRCQSHKAPGTEYDTLE